MDDVLHGLIDQIKEHNKSKKAQSEPTTQEELPTTEGTEPVVEEERPIVCKSPNASTFYAVAEASYQKPKDRPQLLNKYWTKVQGFQTPTFTAYQDKQNDTIVVAYRGTQMKSLPDLSADRGIAFNKLSQSDRYRKDLQTTQKLLQQYGSSCLYSVGHSLGGAVQLQIQRDLDKPFRAGRGFNSALQPKDLVNKPKNFEQWYIKNDPLYKLMGRRLPKKNVFVFPAVDEKKSLPNHSLSNFKGLKKQDSIQRPRGGARKPNLNDLHKLGLVTKEDKKTIDPWEMDRLYR